MGPAGRHNSAVGWDEAEELDRLRAACRILLHAVGAYQLAGPRTLAKRRAEMLLAYDRVRALVTGKGAGE